MVEYLNALGNIWQDVVVWITDVSGLKLREYQEGPARAIVEAIAAGKGGSIVVLFPRQSGKNELQAQVEAYLLVIFSRQGGEMVKVSPTWKPQSQNAMRRLERVLVQNLVVRTWLKWKKEQGYIFRIGKARLYFLSGQPGANVVGATSNVLLQCDEAQEVQITKWDKDFAPMAASTNAVRVFWGTAWTSRTLLARELAAAEKAEKRDGIQRVFRLTADDVAAEVPAYGDYVAEQVRRLGRQHPLVKTQYFSEFIDAEGGMFPPFRQALMKGKHPRQIEPSRHGDAGTTSIYAFMVDVAGEDESASDEIADLERDELKNPARDATALTIVEVDLSTLQDDLIKAPTYKVVDRREWVGIKHSRLYGELRALADVWEPRYIVCDSTGVGAGLSSFLDKALPGRVLPYVFTSKSKSDLGWAFLAVCDTGRFKDYAVQDGYSDKITAQFWTEIENVQYEATETKVIKWGVPDGTRDIVTGDLVHDDLVISAALCAELDAQEWSIGGEALIVQGVDPLEDMDKGF
jgi:hypothetical protein